MGAQRIISSLFVCFALVVAVSCNRVRPTAPAEVDFAPPIADPVSYVAGDVAFDIHALERKVNQLLNPVIVTEETFKGQKGEAWRLRVERTGPVTIQYANQRVYLAAPLQVWYSNPIGLRKHKKQQTLCALAVRFVSPLSVGTNWRLTINAHFEDYQWIQKPSVRVLGFNIEVTKLVDRILEKRKGQIEAAINQAVHNELRLDQHVRKVWADLQQPLLISRAPAELWLIPRPFSIAAGAVHGNAKQIIVPLQIAFRVATHIGDKPVISQVQPLPRLLRRSVFPTASRLQVLAFIPYSDVNRVLASRLSSQKIELAGGTVNVKTARVYGSGHSLIVQTEVSGAVKGTLYFRGQPRYDTLTNTLRVDNVDFDVHTEERLLATADWLLHDHLRDTLQAVMVVPLRQQIAGIPDKIETAFAHSKGGRKTALDVNEFRLVPQRIVVRPDGVQILISVHSNVFFLIRKL